MKSPLVEALDLTHAMLAAAKAGDWTHFGNLHKRRTQLLKPGLYTHADAPRLLPQLDAAQKELTAVIASAHEEARRNWLDSQRAHAAASAYLDAAQG
jgi:multidrug resistance efflux pump